MAPPVAEEVPFAAHVAHTYGWISRRMEIGEAKVQRSRSSPLVSDADEEQQLGAGTGGNYDDIARQEQLFGAQSVSDPTRGKVLKVLLWIQVALTRLEKCMPKAAETGGYMRMSGITQCYALSSHFQTIDRVDTVVLPLPYNQLLKILCLCWGFSLPFVIAKETGWFLPFLMFLISTAFFGLDQVRACALTDNERRFPPHPHMRKYQRVPSSP